MRRGFGKRDTAVGAARAQLGPAAARLRRILDPDAVLQAAAAEAASATGARRAEVWLTADDDGLRLAASAGRPGIAPDAPPAPVVACARRRKPASLDGAVATPIPAPRRGLAGVLYLLDPASPDTAAVAAALAEETGLAYEAANLFRSAVTALGRTEAVLERVADGIVVTDGSGTVRSVNRAAERLLAVRAEAVPGSSCAAALGLRLGERQLDCSDGCALLREPNAGSPGVEVSRTRADGRRQPLLVSASAVGASDDAPEEVVHSLRDITALKQADEAKTMFLATASHELKTPLTVILGFAQTLRSGRLSAEQSDHALEAIERRAMELGKIVDRLLLTGRIESGRVTVHPEPIAIEAHVEERAASLAAATGRDVRAAVPDDLPDAIADLDALITVIDHLLDNAVKYSPEGEPVRIAARASAAQIEIAVSDRGIGMDAEEIEHCFERFWQAETSDVRRFGGAGVGLYIVRSLVEAMGGSVVAQSVLGSGSTFVVRLRRAVPVAEPHPAPEPVVEVVGGERSMIKEFMRQIGIPSGGS